MSMVASFFDYSLEVTGTAGTIAIGPSDTRVLLRQGPDGVWTEQETSPALADTFDQWVKPSRRATSTPTT
ncbi:hypothetical protein KNN17_20265 [Arthrobacter bambusae]|uniref:hypothetical protein n=1 Tax=Arthrobacter bambusae TaxID=1338426 RepID=UPI001F515608|nr:hypothetical protein [Arthrobacter bambusae]MCI0143900.1 hypothetical protein [Arthrobacter bambusae]